MAFRNKTLSLQRAYFNEGFNDSLENVLRRIYAKLPRAKDRIVEIDLFANQIFAGIEEAPDGNGVFVRIFEFEQGAIGVINLDTTDNNAAIDEFFHPKKQDFLKDEIVIYIVENHLVACNLKNKGGTLSNCMLRLAGKCEVLGADVNMKIADVPDKTTLEKIQTVGVKSVDFSINSFMENLDVSSKSRAGNRVMQMVLGMPASNSKVRKRANAVGRLSLKRGRFLKEEVRKDEWLTNIGTELITAGSSESYKIVLEDGSTVSNNNLKKSRVAELKRHANSYSFESAKVALANYYDELSVDGSLGA